MASVQESGNQSEAKPLPGRKPRRSFLSPDLSEVLHMLEAYEDNGATPKR